MKKYVYRKKFYNVRVVMVGYFCFAILAYAVYRFFATGEHTLWGVIAVVAGYQIFNTFLSLSNPEEVDIDDHRITFRGFGKEHSYDFKQIYDFRVKEFPSNQKIYLRINKNDTNIFKGRYWIDCYYFENGEELFKYLLDKEDEMHPYTIKAHAHRSNQFTPEEKEKIEQRKKERKEKSIFNRKRKKEDINNGSL